MMPEVSAAPEASSFRDPAGFVFKKDGIIYRQLMEAYQPHYEQLLASGLYQDLVREGLLVAHDDVTPHEQPTGYYKTLLPEQLPFISYPYEWCFSQLKEAALLTLQVQKKALAHQMSLKDASAYNVQFRGHKAIFIDLLSFEPHQQGKPWVAYRQFCQHFLAPLALMAKTDVQLNQLLVTNLDGIPLSLASKLLPKKTWLNFGLLVHLHLHQKAQQKLSGPAKPAPAAKLNANAALQLIESLESTVSQLEWNPGNTTWANYYNETNYSADGMQSKEALVKSFLSKVTSGSILDLGANNGYFSKLASEFAPLVLAVDADPAAVEQHFIRLRAEKRNGIFPLLVDITNPGPAIGWNNRERDAFLKRSDSDTILALAVIHHLAIGNNLPLGMLASFFAENCQNLIIEFIPKTDSQVRKMVSGREDIFPHYSEEQFEAAFLTHFACLAKEPVQQTQRTLFLLQRR